MNKHIFKIIIPVIGTILLTCSFLQLKSQDMKTSGDSLSLKQIINEVVQNYPSILEASEALNISNAKIGLAKSGYYPYVDITASYTRIGPVPELTFPGLGTFKFYPENNFNSALEYNQTLYDFGKTKRNINYEKENKSLTQQSLEQMKQKLSMSATANFYTLLFLQEAINIKNEELHTLKEHLEFVEKKKETGSATQYEILTTKVKISNVESQKLDLISALTVQQTILNSLLGQTEKTHHAVKKDLVVTFSELPVDSLLSYAVNHRDEMKIAKEKIMLSELQLKIVKGQNNPVFNVFADGGWKNGYIPDLNPLKANFVAGVGLRVPLFDATKTKFNVMQVKSNIKTNNLETEVIKRNITNEIVENQSNIQTSRKKFDQFKLQLELAQKALSLAEISFKAGAITNLDLLDATTSVSESRLNLLKSNIDYIISVYKLKVALGERLY